MNDVQARRRQLDYDVSRTGVHVKVLLEEYCTLQVDRWLASLTYHLLKAKSLLAWIYEFALRLLSRCTFCV